MRVFCRSFAAVAAAVLVSWALAPSASAQCVSGTITAEFQSSGEFAGLWKYTLDFTWDTPSGLSNVTLDCGLDCDPDLACMQTYLFPDPAGTSTGEPDNCTALYSGEFNCQGNPSIGLNKPIIKWDALNGGCEPGKTGSGTLCVYTNIPPVPDNTIPVILIKDGQDVCEGTISGQCPTLCPVSADPSTWGGVKIIYR